jgi:LacI family transcriptional regulator
MTTLSDVAARAGVSVSAVSRVLRDAPSTRVSAETRQRIQDAARELGYRPNFAARALKSARTNVIGLVVPVVTNAIFSDILRGAEEEAQRHGYLVFVARTEGMIDGEETIPRLIGEGRVDGVLLQVGDAMRPEDLHIFLNGALPLVVINSVHPGHVGSVTLDDARGIRMATEHLIALGHTRIGFVGGLPRSDSARRREQGFRDAMADAGLAIPDGFVTRLGYEPRQGGAALAKLAAHAPRPTAIVAANVNAAHGALLEARRLGIAVPQELSIAAMHDTWTAENAWPPLTTVRMPLVEFGRQAVRDLLERIETGTLVDRVVSEPAPELVVRESTAPPAR